MVLAGREEVLTAAEEAIAIAALDRRTPAPLLLVGARGVGKTVLLGEIAERTGAAHGWPHAHLEVTISRAPDDANLRVSNELSDGPAIKLADMSASKQANNPASMFASKRAGRITTSQRETETR